VIEESLLPMLRNLGLSTSAGGDNQHTWSPKLEYLGSYTLPGEIQDCSSRLRNLNLGFSAGANMWTNLLVCNPHYRSNYSASCQTKKQSYQDWGTPLATWAEPFECGGDVRESLEASLTRLLWQANTYRRQLFLSQWDNSGIAGSKRNWPLIIGPLITAKQAVATATLHISEATAAEPTTSFLSHLHWPPQESPCLPGKRAQWCLLDGWNSTLLCR